MLRRLDRSKPFGEVFGAFDGHKYEQGGFMFDGEGLEVRPKTAVELAQDSAIQALINAAAKISAAYTLMLKADGSTEALVEAAKDAEDLKHMDPEEYIMKHMGRGKYDVLTTSGEVVAKTLTKEDAQDKVAELNGQGLNLDDQLTGQIEGLAQAGAPFDPNAQVGGILNGDGAPGEEAPQGIGLPAEGAPEVKDNPSDTDPVEVTE